MLDDTHKKYFLFRLGPQLFGTLAIEIREVTEVIEPKMVPKMIPSFKGIINLRGEVIGLIDLRARFGFKPSQTKCYLIFDTAKGTIAAAIDAGVTMVGLQDHEIDGTNVEIAKVPKEFITGTVKHGDELAVIVQLGAILTQEELVAFDELRIVS